MSEGFVMRRNIALCVVALALIALAAPLCASEPSEKDEGNAGIGLWLAASDIDVLGAYIANWLPFFEPPGSATGQRAERRKSDGPSYLQAAAGYLELAGPWTLANGMMVRAGFTNGSDRDAPIAPGAPSAITGNRLAQVYEMLGRHVFVTLSATF